MVCAKLFKFCLLGSRINYICLFTCHFQWIFDGAVDKNREKLSQSVAPSLPGVWEPREMHATATERYCGYFCAAMPAPLRTLACASSRATGKHWVHQPAPRTFWHLWGLNAVFLSYATVVVCVLTARSIAWPVDKENCCVTDHWAL